MTPDLFSFHIVKIKPADQPIRFQLMAHRRGTSLFTLFFYFGIIEALEAALEVLGFDESTVLDVKARVMSQVVTPVGIVEIDDNKMGRLVTLSQI
jgi:hypothetical protein